MDDAAFDKLMTRLVIDAEIVARQLGITVSEADKIICHTTFQVERLFNPKWDPYHQRRKR